MLRNWPPLQNCKGELLAVVMLRERNDGQDIALWLLNILRRGWNMALTLLNILRIAAAVQTILDECPLDRAAELTSVIQHVKPTRGDVVAVNDIGHVF
jgi:hypothetical protein